MSKLQVKIVSIVSAVVCLFGICALISACSQNAENNILTYQVNEDLSFNANYKLDTFDDAAAVEKKITDHVDSAAGDMQKIFDKNKVSILDYGAKTHSVFAYETGKFKASSTDQETIDDLAKNNTKAIYKAICEVSKKGGGTVNVPAANGDVFYTCAIHLEDNVNLHIEEGATLKYTTNTSLYVGDFMKEVYGDGVDEDGLTLTRYESVECMNYSPFIYAYGKKNIAVTGKGTIDGSATKGNKVNPTSGSWAGWSNQVSVVGKKGTYSFDKSRPKLFAEGQKGTPVKDRKYGEGSGDANGLSDDGWLRPNFVQPYNCQNFLIKDINVVNSPMWDINPILCDTVLMDSVNIDSHMPNNDGVDAECTSNMVIRNNTFNLDDDAIVIKSGRNEDGRRIGKATYNIVAANNLIKDGHGGITLGSEITGGAKNLFVHDNVMTSDHLQNPYRFKTNYIRGGAMENIFLKNDTVKSVSSNHAVVSVDLSYGIKESSNGNEVQMMEDLGVKYKAYMPSLSNVHIDNFNSNTDKVSGKGGKCAFELRGFDKASIAKSCEAGNDITDCYVSNFTMENSHFWGSQQAFDTEYVNGLKLKNVSINGGVVEDKFDNCKNFDFENCDFTNSKISKEKLEAIEGSKIINCKFD